jgi:adenylate kinase family enzyme
LRLLLGRQPCSYSEDGIEHAAAKTKEEMDKKREIFLNRGKEAKVTISDRDMDTSDRTEVLGIDFDLTTKQYRLSPRRIEKLQQRNCWNKGLRTKRELLGVLDACFWASQVRRERLWNRAKAVDILRRLADDLTPSGLEKVMHLTPAEEKALEEWKDTTTQNEGVRGTPERKP